MDTSIRETVHYIQLCLLLVDQKGQPARPHPKPVSPHPPPSSLPPTVHPGKMVQQAILTFTSRVFILSQRSAFFSILWEEKGEFSLYSFLMLFVFSLD